MHHRFKLLTLSALLLAGCGTNVVNPVTGKAERTVMSEAAELAEGQKGHEAVLKEYTPYADPKVQAYVNDLGQRLAKQSHRANLSWHFTVLDSPEINAFALPGGYVYVTRGIMAYMDSEADLAGVMGHEIGHVTARHGAQRATKQQDAGLGVLAASVLGAVLEAKGMKGAGKIASDVSQNVAAGYVANYSREQESQADGLGAQYLAATHYNPANMVDVIKVLKNQEQFAADRAKAEGRPAPSGANWLSSHPSNDKRLSDIRQTAAQYPGPDQGKYADDGRARYQQVIAGLAYGESADQGLTRGRNFYHQDLGIALTAPEGWKIQNGADQLVIVNGEGTAGLIVKPVPKKASGTHEQVIKQLLNPTSGRLTPLQINGLSASRFQGQRKTAQGQVQNINLTLVDGPKGNQYALLPSAKDANTLEANRSPLQAAEQSFRAMTELDRTAARPWLIKFVPYPRGGFAQLAQQSPLSQPAEQQLRLLNGYYSGGEPRPGEMVKVIVAR
jgi:predicted Zn-dependent protease